MAGCVGDAIQYGVCESIGGNSKASITSVSAACVLCVLPGLGSAEEEEACQ